MSDDLDRLPGMSDLDGMLLEAQVLAAADPMKRFLDTLGDAQMRAHAEDTIKLRAEFIAHAQRVVTPVDVRDALASAEWLRVNAQHVAYRWAGLVRVVKRWSELACEATVVAVQSPRR